MQKELESLWQKCVAFHGHGCGGLAVGFRAVLYAWELFGCDSPSEDEKIVCVAETDACGVDAIQALLSCTVGKRELDFQSTGEKRLLLLPPFGRKVLPPCSAPNTGENQGRTAGVAYGWGLSRDV